MFESGDIVRITQDNDFWVIIEKDMPSNIKSNEYLWRMRSREHGKRLPKCATAWSADLLLIYRPRLFVSQQLMFRDLFVEVIKDEGVRVKCAIVGHSAYQSFYLCNSDIYVGRQLDIFKPALIEYNILSFFSDWR